MFDAHVECPRTGLVWARVEFAEFASSVAVTS
jgi:hypothetical protein